MKTERKTARRLVIDALTQEILDGKHPPEKPLPGEHPLCERFNTSRTTIRSALSEMEMNGLVYRRHGKGTFAHPTGNMQAKPIALFIDQPKKLSHTFYANLINGANSHLTPLRSHVSIISHRPSEWDQELIKSLGGVIIVPTTSVQRKDIDLIKEWDLPLLVCADTDLDAPQISYNISDAACELTLRLLELGHRHIALLSGHSSHSDRLKKEGIARALASVDIELASIPDYMTNYDENLGREAALDLLKKHPNTTAIIAFDDALAIKAMQVAQNLRRTVPFDISVVGFNDDPISSLIDPPLTTVKIPTLEAGRKAAEILCEARMRSTPVKNIELGFEIQWRHTSAPCTS